MSILAIIAAVVGILGGIKTAGEILAGIKKLWRDGRISAAQKDAAVSVVKTIVATRGTPRDSTPISMDDVAHAVAVHRCSFCRQEGHNIRTCKAAKRAGR